MALGFTRDESYSLVHISSLPGTPGEDEATNPERYGKALALWVADVLHANCWSTEGVVPEDWGWSVVVERKPVLLSVCCGNEEGSSTRWSILVAVETGFVGKLLGRKAPTAEIARLWDFIENAARGHPGVSAVELEGEWGET